jgi:hypothetical protein
MPSGPARDPDPGTADGYFQTRRTRFARFGHANFATGPRTETDRQWRGFNLSHNSRAFQAPAVSDGEHNGQADGRRDMT